MAKELIIVQGIYKVGTDFPEGSYLFDSNLGDNVAPVSLTSFKEASLDSGLITLIV